VPRSRVSGLTLIEILIALVVVGVLSAYAIVRNASPATYTAYSQAQTLAANLRHTQTLASTWGRNLTFTLTGGTLQGGVGSYMLNATNGTYSVKCTTTANTTSPCNGASAVTDPATGSSFSVSLEKNVVISGPSSMTFDSLGKPSASTYVYTLTASSISVTVTVSPVTGFVTVAGS
jgi:prepilin-type N-terminal cleavage/methylation domain-containing protein